MRKLASPWLSTIVAVVFANSIIPHPSHAQSADPPPPKPSYEQAREQLALFLKTLKRIRQSLNDVSFDPHARAEATGPDIGSLFRFVRDEIVFEPYLGVLRFAEGTLMSGAGNSFDKSLLLASMLDSQGFNVRFARARLTDELSRMVLATMAAPKLAVLENPLADLNDPSLAQAMQDLGMTAPEANATLGHARTRVTGFLRSLGKGSDFSEALLMRKLADKGVSLEASDTDSNSALLEVARDHCWVQVLVDGKWTDLDPSAGSLKFGSRLARPDWIGQQIPATLLYRVHALIRIQQKNSSNAVEHAVLDVEVPLRRPISHLNVSMAPELAGGITGIGEAKALDRVDVVWPVLRLDGERYTGLPFNVNGELVDKDPRKRPSTPSGAAGATKRITGVIGGLLDGGAPAPPPIGQLQQLTLTLDVISPDGRRTTVKRDLARVPDGLQAGAAKIQVRRQLIARFDILAAALRVPAAYPLAHRIDYMIEHRQALFALLADAYNKPGYDIARLLEFNVRPYPFEALAYLTTRAALLDYNRNRAFPGLGAFPAAPQLIAYRFGALPSRGADPAINAGYDVLTNSLQVVRLPGASPTTGGEPAKLRLQQGILDTLTEYLLVGGGEATNSYSVIARAIAENIPILTLRQGDEAKLTDLPVSAAVRAGVKSDLDHGFVVVMPAKQVKLDNHVRFAWWRIHPKGGETLGMAGFGEGQAMTEYAKLAGASVASITAVCSTQMYYEAENRTGSFFGHCLWDGIFFTAIGFAAFFAAGQFLAWAVGTGIGMYGASQGGGRANRPRPIDLPEPPIETPGQQRPTPEPDHWVAAGQRKPSAGEEPVIRANTSTVIEGPVRRSAKAGSGTFVEPASQARPQFTPEQEFNATFEDALGASRLKSSPNVDVARNAWSALKPEGRIKAQEAFSKLDKADPFGDPVSRLQQITLAARDDLTPNELMAMQALKEGRSASLSLGRLADAAGISPHEMRYVLEGRAKAFKPDNLLRVEADGRVSIQQQTPGMRPPFTEHDITQPEFDMLRLNRNSDRQQAARDVQKQFKDDQASGLNPEQSIVGHGYSNGFSAKRVMTQTGLNANQVQERLVDYLQVRQQLSASAARKAANAYVNGPGTQSPQLAPATRPPGPPSPPSSGKRIPAAKTPSGKTPGASGSHTAEWSERPPPHRPISPRARENLKAVQPKALDKYIKEATRQGRKPEPDPSKRASWIADREQTLHDVIDGMYPKDDAPKLHVTNTDGLRGIIRAGKLDPPLRGGASFSPGGSIKTLREGNVAIRVKPGHENFVEFISTPQGLGFKPVGTGKSYLSSEHLQYLDPGKAPGLERWLDLPPAKQN
jgi:hypothetical protein